MKGEDEERGLGERVKEEAEGRGCTVNVKIL